MKPRTILLSIIPALILVALALFPWLTTIWGSESVFDAKFNNYDISRQRYIEVYTSTQYTLQELGIDGEDHWIEMYVRFEGDAIPDISDKYKHSYIKASTGYRPIESIKPEDERLVIFIRLGYKDKISEFALLDKENIYTLKVRTLLGYSIIVSAEKTNQ